VIRIKKCNNRVTMNGSGAEKMSVASVGQVEKIIRSIIIIIRVNHSWTVVFCQFSPSVLDIQHCHTVKPSNNAKNAFSLIRNPYT
jgi:hypothetical protein